MSIYRIPRQVANFLIDLLNFSHCFQLMIPLTCSRNQSLRQNAAGSAVRVFCSVKKSLVFAEYGHVFCILKASIFVCL